MRAIKFKGKSSINGKWVCGDSIKHTDNATEKGIEELIYIGRKVPNASKVGAMKWAPVDPDTIGQFSGVVDRNGTEIYEGDIVRISDNISPRGHVGEVKFHEGCFTVYLGERYYPYHNLNVRKSEWRDMNATIPIEYKFEVIGNVFDNKDLLEE